jgi:hypothetical protein
MKTERHAGAHQKRHIVKYVVEYNGNLTGLFTTEQAAAEWAIKNHSGNTWTVRPIHTLPGTIDLYDDQGSDR